MSKVLVVESCFYPAIATASLNIVQDILLENGIEFDKVSVPGAFELPSAINMIIETINYDGVIALGCIVKGETYHHNIIAAECARTISDLAIHYSMPIGFGLITASTLKQAEKRAEEYAKRAANACISLMKIKLDYYSFNNNTYSVYNN